MAVPWRSSRRGGNLCCHSGSGRRKGRAPHHSRGFYGPGTAWPADTGSDSRLYSHSHQPFGSRGKAYISKFPKWQLFSSRNNIVCKYVFQLLWNRVKVNEVEVSVRQWSQPSLWRPWQIERGGEKQRAVKRKKRREVQVGSSPVNAALLWVRIDCRAGKEELQWPWPVDNNPLN